VAKPPLERIVAFVVSELVHVTFEVISFVLLSEYVPVAVNCSVEPTAKLIGGFGVTATEFNVGAPIANGVPVRYETGTSPDIVGGDAEVLIEILVAVFHWLLYQYCIVESAVTEELLIVIVATAPPKSELDVT
jgi:hypothetical protein